MRGDSGYAYLPAGQAEVEFSKYKARIKALEKLNATLAAEIDRMRPVVEATIRQVNRDDDRFSWYDLKQAVNVYEASKRT